MVAAVSAGAKGNQFAQVQLTSGEVRKINRNATAVIGSVSNREHQHKQLGKAGRSRWLGRKPRNRGVSMNAYASILAHSHTHAKAFVLTALTILMEVVVVNPRVTRILARRRVLGPRADVHAGL